jgi:hypothetical protein
MIIALVGNLAKCEEFAQYLKFKRQFQIISYSIDLLDDVYNAISKDKSRWFIKAEVRIVIYNFKNSKQLNLLSEFKPLVVKIGKSKFVSDISFQDLECKQITKIICKNISKRRDLSRLLTGIVELSFILFVILFIIFSARFDVHNRKIIDAPSEA